MDESSVEKQNRLLKIVLLLLIIPIVSGLSILAYHFLTKSDTQDVTMTGKTPSVNRDAPYAANSATPPPATPASTPTPAATATPAAAPALPKSTLPLVGKWMMTGPTKTIYSFEEPKKVGNTEVGLMQTTIPTGKSYDSNYTLDDRQIMRFEANGETYLYEVSNNGKSLKLEVGGRTLYFVRVR